MRFEWGPNGLRTLAPVAQVLIIVDVLRFTTAVSVATAAGGLVLPYRWADDGAAAFAAAHGAELAGRRHEANWSLSPTDLAALPPGTRLVLPSPNGSALSFAARELGAHHVAAGCLRNATATAAYAIARAPYDVMGAIAVVAAGERWRNHTGPIRPALEDLLGAGAIIDILAQQLGAASLSPDASAARAAFADARPVLEARLAECATGRELAERGWSDDVASSAALDACDVAAELRDETFLRAG